MSHHYGYSEKTCLFSTLSALLLIHLTLLLKSHFRHNFRKKMKEKKLNAIKPFGLRIAPLLVSFIINIKTFKNTLSLIFHPGALLNQLFSLTHTTAMCHFLIHIPKNKTSKNYILDFQTINTDGSKVEDRFAVHIYRAAIMKRFVFLMAHLFTLLNPRLLILLWITLGTIL